MESPGDVGDNALGTVPPLATNEGTNQKVHRYLDQQLPGAMAAGGHRLALQNRAAARNVQLTVKTIGIRLCMPLLPVPRYRCIQWLLHCLSVLQ